MRDFSRFFRQFFWLFHKGRYDRDCSKKTVSFSPPLSCIIFLHRFSRFKDETEVDVNSKTFLFENCSCNRTVFDIEENKTNSVKFSQTTCGREAFQKGSNQKASLSTGTVHLKLTRLENISLGSRRNMGGEISEKLDEVFFYIFFFHSIFCRNPR